MPTPFKAPSPLAVSISARIQARKIRELAQKQLFDENKDFHETVRMKLDGRLESNQFFNFSRCGNEQIFRTCESCRAVEKFDYRCSLKWCPRCQWWLAERRKKVLQVWAVRIAQPKHLVLTQRNFPILTRSKIREHQRNLARIRKARCFEKVKGGCVSVEITNEDNGWHLHSHWLLDVRWLNMEQVSQAWGALVGQEFAIVKVKDVRETDYLKEVSKYVCEGSEIASWPAEHILEFVTAIRGRRFFFSFGTLFKAGASIRAELAAQKPEVQPCECGCSEFIYESEIDAVLNEVRKMSKKKR